MRVEGAADDGEVAQPLGEAAGWGVVTDQAQLDLGVIFLPATLELGRVAAEGGPGVADVQAAVAGGGLADELVGAGQQDARAGEHLDASRRRGDAPAGPVQQPHAEYALERGQGTRDRGLGDAEPKRGVGEAAGLDDGEQAPQVLQLECRRVLLPHIHTFSVSDVA
jgi:hypothetical protein